MSQISVIQILSDIGDTIKTMKLHPITVLDSGLSKQPQMFLLPPGTANIKKTLCNTQMGDCFYGALHARLKPGYFIALLLHP
jgi:hypothetical protein